MNVDNIIIIFGPNLLWEHKADQENTVAVNINNVLEILINEAADIFPDQIVSLEHDQVLEDFEEYQKMNQDNAYILDCISSPETDSPAVRKDSNSASPATRKVSDSKSSSPNTRKVSDSKSSSPNSRKSSDTLSESPTTRKSSESKAGQTIKEGFQSMFPRKVTNQKLNALRRGTSATNSTETVPDSPS